MRKVEHHLLSKLKCPKLFFIKIEKGITSVIQVLNMLNCGLPHQDNADPQLYLTRSFEKTCPQFEEVLHAHLQFFSCLEAVILLKYGYRTLACVYSWPINMGDKVCPI